MDKKLFVVFIAVGTIVITTVLQIFMQGDKVSRVNRGLLWAVLGVGVLALGCMIAIALAD